MPKKPLFDCETVFPRIAAIIREADGYIASYDILLKLAHDPVVREIAPDSKTAFLVAEKATGIFGQHYTMERTKFGMDRYRHEFTRIRDGNYWAYKVSDKWSEQTKRCYLCEKEFELTHEVFQTSLLYAQMSIKRDIKWKDMVLTVFAKNSKDEDVLLCKGCFSSALSRSSQEVRKTSIPMTAGIQFRGF